MRKIMLFWAKIAGFENRKEGNCLFFGSPEFMQIVSNALTMLEKTDNAMLLRLRNYDAIFYNNSKSISINFSNRMFSLGNNYYSWKEVGVITFCVSVLLYKEDPKSTSKRVADWLAQHNYPNEIIDVFRGQERMKKQKISFRDIVENLLPK